MNEGDVVRWIGFSKKQTKSSWENWNIPKLGIIINVYAASYKIGDLRFDIMWSDGTIGTGIFEETIQRLWRSEWV